MSFISPVVPLSLSKSLGVSRLAFTVVHSSQPESVASVLASVGFRAVQQHRTKPITLFQSQDAYLMLHRTPHSMPPFFGLMVRDVDAALRQVTACDASIEVHGSGPVGPLGLHIPAVRSSDGTYFYLVEEGEADSFFALDFAYC